MISRRVRIQLLVFLLISVLGIVYTGLTYVGVHIVGGPYTITADFPTSGGIFTNAAVTYRGVTVGKVGALHLLSNGVGVDLQIHSGTHIPKNTRAVIANLSAVGEQYVDLEPTTAGPPYLKPGGVIPMADTQLPINDASLLQNLDTLIRSVNQQQLGTVISELGTAFTGVGPDLQRLIDSGDQLTAAAQAALPQTIKLINDGLTVLNTQRATSSDLQTFTANLASLSQQIVASDPDIRRLFAAGAAGAQQLQGLFQDNRSALPLFLSNFNTLGQIQEARIPGMKSILVLYPLNVANGFLAAAPIPGVSNIGIAHFGLVVQSNPSACTAGYNTNRRPNTRPYYGGASNTNTYCQEPKSGPSDVRGARNAPRPPGDNTATPPPGGYQQTGPSNAYGPTPPPGSDYQSNPSPAAGGGSSSSSSGGSSPAAAPTFAPYDPVSGLLMAPNGQTYQLGSTGGEQQVLGSQGWAWLLLGPLLG